MFTGPAATHVLAIDTRGRLYAWGRNTDGQLGLGDVVQRNQPCLVADLAEMRVVAGSCGRGHTAVVDDTGASWTCGDNRLGQLGVDSV